MSIILTGKDGTVVAKNISIGVVFVSADAIKTYGLDLLRTLFPASDLVTGDPNDPDSWVAAE